MFEDAINFTWRWPLCGTSYQLGEAKLYKSKAIPKRTVALRRGCNQWIVRRSVQTRYYIHDSIIWIAVEILLNTTGIQSSRISKKPL